jgi:hypothetical protein
VKSQEYREKRHRDDGFSILYSSLLTEEKSVRSLTKWKKVVSLAADKPRPAIRL